MKIINFVFETEVDCKLFGKISSEISRANSYIV